MHYSDFPVFCLAQFFFLQANFPVKAQLFLTPVIWRIFFTDIEVANRHGHTCLMIACYKGHLKIARFLIDAKADVNRKSVKGNTALHDCAESGSLEIMKLLLANGAKIDVDAYGTESWPEKQKKSRTFLNFPSFLLSEKNLFLLDWLSNVHCG